MADPLRAARARLRSLSDVPALVEARQRDADEIKRYGRWTAMNVQGLEAEIANAQAEVARLVRTYADALAPNKED